MTFIFVYHNTTKKTYIMSSHIRVQKVIVGVLFRVQKVIVRVQKVIVRAKKE